MFCLLLGRRLRQIRLLLHKISDEQIEQAVVIPIGDTDLRAASAADVFRGTLSGCPLNGWNELDVRGQ